MSTSAFITIINRLKKENEELKMENEILVNALSSQLGGNTDDAESVGDWDPPTDDTDPDYTESLVDDSDSESVVAESGSVSDCSCDTLFSRVNEELSVLFTRLAEKEVNLFKKNVYVNAATVIKELPYEVSYGHQLTDIKGIGSSVSHLIDEYMRTGGFSKLHEA